MSRISTTNRRALRKLWAVLLYTLLAVALPAHGRAEDSPAPTAISSANVTLSMQEPLTHNPAVTHPIREIFSHAGHQDAFTKLGVQCTDCHDFSVKPASPGPLASAIPAGLLRPQRGVCHQCHLGKIAVPSPNQCAICHVSNAAIKPQDHLLNWSARHGRFAQFHRENCTQCHTQQSCNQCHSRLDRMNPTVHPGSFRLFHSVKARANPQSCVECHKTRSFCIDCHSGRRAQ